MTLLITIAVLNLLLIILSFLFSSLGLSLVLLALANIVFCVLGVGLTRYILKTTEPYTDPERTAYQLNEKTKGSAAPEALKPQAEILPKQGQIVWHDSRVIAGDGVFDLLTAPLKYSRVYCSVNDQIKGGALLVAGQPTLKIDGVTTSSFAADLLKYLHHPKGHRYLILGLIYGFGSLALQLLFVYLRSSAGIEPLSNLSLGTLLAYSFYWSSGILLLFYLLALQQKLQVYSKLSLFAKGIIVSDLLKLSTYEKFILNAESANQKLLKPVNYLVYSDQFEAKKINLILFYLSSFCFHAEQEDTDFDHFEALSAIRDYLVTIDQPISFFNSPLTQIELEKDGIRARLDDMEILFGLETYLLNNQIILDTAEVISRKGDNTSFYCAFNKVVVCGVSVSKTDSHDYKQVLKQALNDKGADLIVHEQTEQQQAAYFNTKLKIKEPKSENKAEQAARKKLLPEISIGQNSAIFSKYNQNIALIINGNSFADLPKAFYYSKIARAARLYLISALAIATILFFVGPASLSFILPLYLMLLAFSFLLIRMARALR